MADEAVRPPLIGNRWVLVGGIFYLLEWVAIIGAGIVGVNETAGVGTSPQEILDSYSGHVDAVAFMAGWFALALLGRVLVFVGLRSALADSGRSHLLMDFAVVASAVSVTLEVAAYGLAAAAADLADAQDTTAMVILDRAGGWLNQLLEGGLAVAIVCSAWCMWRSRLFSMPLNVLGAVAGIGIVFAQLSIAPSLATLFAILGFSVPLFWIWMLWAGVVSWCHTPKAGSSDASVVPEVATG